MKTQGSRIGLTAALLFWAGWIAFSGTSSATLENQKEAKAAGATVKDCATCHVDKLPKKDSHALNDAGNWLVAEKEKRGAKAVDGAWLKEYPGKK